jgi:hypothetical protein
VNVAELLAADSQPFRPIVLNFYLLNPLPLESCIHQQVRPMPPCH